MAAFITKTDEGFDFIDLKRGLKMTSVTRQIVDFLKKKKERKTDEAERAKIDKAINAWQNIHDSFGTSKTEAELKAAFALNFGYFLVEYLYAG